MVAAMNQFSEQFKLLHQEAGFTTQGVNDETLNKFGNLVVQQCIRIALTSMTTYTAAERIKEHFKQ
jgi:ribosomal protein L11